MRNRRDRRGGNSLVLHVTNRTICGLPFVCRLFMSLILRGILAKAQNLYPVQICHFQWMGNHYHIILTGRAQYISPFGCYMQGEVAKSIKRLTRQYQTKVWTGRAKEQRLCTAEDVLGKIVYLYANPVRAGLVARAADWPGLSSFQMYQSGSLVFLATWIPFRVLRKLPKNVDYLRDITLLKKLSLHGEGEYEFHLSPNAWRRCFAESRSWSDIYIYERISSGLRQRENEFAGVWGHGVVGSRSLRRQSIHKHYAPKKKDRTPFLECCDKEMRKVLIQAYREFCDQCRLAWQRWKQGELSVAFPVGAYRPGVPLLGKTF